MRGNVKLGAPALMPGAVMAALDYIRYADGVRSPRSLFDGAPAAERDLTSREQAVYDAALQVLLHYFTGERDFCQLPDDPPDDGPPPSQAVHS